MLVSAKTKYFTHTLPLSPHISLSPKYTLTLAYRTYGSPSSPAVLLPTCYGGHLPDTTPFLYCGPSAPFPPSQYFVVVTGLLGGSESSSPSCPNPGEASGEASAKPDEAQIAQGGADFPHTTYATNIHLQHALLTSLGVKRLKAYIGFSMGGQQAYHMALLYPRFVEHMVCLAGSARTSKHNWSFLEGPKAALVNSVDFHDGRYTQPARRGTGAFGRVYSTWALSPEWFRQKSWKKVGYETYEEFLDKEWENGLGAWDANDLLCLLRTWQGGDVTEYFPEDEGDLGKTLGRVDANCLIMPSRTDAYFPPEDSEFEVKHLKHARLRVIESIWGHLAGGGGGTQDDNDFFANEIHKFVVLGQ